MRDANIVMNRSLLLCAFSVRASRVDSIPTRPTRFANHVRSRMRARARDAPPQASSRAMSRLGHVQRVAAESRVA